MTKEKAYKLGFDCGLNGSNLTNCDFRIFSTPEFTKEWERGKLDGENVKEKKSNDPRDNPLIGEDDSWIHDVDMGAR